MGCAAGARNFMKNCVVCGQVANSCQPAADWGCPLGPARPWRGNGTPALGVFFAPVAAGLQPPFSFSTYRCRDLTHSYDIRPRAYALSIGGKRNETHNRFGGFDVDCGGGVRAAGGGAGDRLPSAAGSRGTSSRGLSQTRSGGPSRPAAQSLLPLRSNSARQTVSSASPAQCPIGLPACSNGLVGQVVNLPPIGNRRALGDGNGPPRPAVVFRPCRRLTFATPSVHPPTSHSTY